MHIILLVYSKWSHIQISRFTGSKIKGVSAVFRPCINILNSLPWLAYKSILYHAYDILHLFPPPAGMWNWCIGILFFLLCDSLPNCKCLLINNDIWVSFHVQTYKTFFLLTSGDISKYQFSLSNNETDCGKIIALIIQINFILLKWLPYEVKHRQKPSSQSWKQRWRSSIDTGF